MSSPHKGHVSLPGSEREPLPGAQLVGAADPNQEMSVTVVLRPRQELNLETASGLNQSFQNMSRDEALKQLENQYGASPEDLAKLQAFAQQYHLTEDNINQAARTVELKGTVASFNSAFGVKLETYRYAGGHYRGRTGEVKVPAELEGIVEAVLGLDDRPQARTHFQFYDPNLHTKEVRPLAGTQPVSYTPLQIAGFYDFPTGVNGSGQCIALIELGGGYQDADLQQYFASLKVPAPKVVAVGVDGAANKPSGDPNGPDGEVMLDIEVAGGVAPGARIAVYFGPNTTRGFLDAINAAIHDSANKPNIISISWGGPESTWTQQAMRAYSQAFQQAGLLGITVCCAAGDNGSSDGVTKDNHPHVDFPASSPYVLACGGTKLVGNGTTITTEVVWNEDPQRSATGGGVSSFFPLPSWQAKAGVPVLTTGKLKAGRGLPDVAGDADPATGYTIQVDGSTGTIGGTSAVAPLWAGLLALVNQKRGKPAGYLNPTIYTSLSNSGIFHDITQGNNGAYSARPGWDACTGLGSPDGKKLLDALTKVS